MPTGQASTLAASCTCMPSVLTPRRWRHSVRTASASVTPTPAFRSGQPLRAGLDHGFDRCCRSRWRRRARGRFRAHHQRQAESASRRRGDSGRLPPALMPTIACQLLIVQGELPGGAGRGRFVSRARDARAGQDVEHNESRGCPYPIRRSGRNQNSWEGEARSPTWSREDPEAVCDVVH